MSKGNLDKRSYTAKPVITASPDISQTTLARPPLEVPRTMVRAILRDYSRYLIDDLKAELKELDARFTDADIVLARRNALISAINIIERGGQYVKSWRFPTDADLRLSAVENEPVSKNSSSRLPKEAELKLKGE